MTLIESMERDAEALGLLLRTWSPGDGVTRYRFFLADDVVSCVRGMDRRNKVPPCTPEKAQERQSYCGPASGVYTALGRKEALAYLAGVATGKQCERRAT